MKKIFFLTEVIGGLIAFNSCEKFNLFDFNISKVK